MLCLTYNKPLHHHPRLNPHLYHPFIHNTCHQELDLQYNTFPLVNECHHLLDFMDTTPHWAATVLEWHWVDEDVGMAIDLATTTMEDMVELLVFKCNAVIPLTHSIHSTDVLLLIASAVDMIQIIKDITFHGIGANQIIIHPSPGPMLTSSLVTVFMVCTKQSYLDSLDILSSTFNSLGW